MNESYLTTDDVAKRWKTSRFTVLRAIRTGKLPAHNLGHGAKRACWRIRLGDVEAFERASRTA